MLATSGAKLLPPAAITNLLKNLLPQTTLLTPNIPEALLLLHYAGVAHPEKMECLEDIVDVAKLVQGLGPKWVLVKGGHAPLGMDDRVTEEKGEGKVVANVLWGHGERWVLKTAYAREGGTHGTGCSLACVSFCSPSKPPSTKSYIPRFLLITLIFRTQLRILTPDFSSNIVQPRSTQADERSRKLRDPVRGGGDPDQ